MSEHPFGTVKFYDGAHDFLCKGKEKVAAETALMFTSYDIRRAISIAGGVQNLMKGCAGTSGDTYAILKETHRKWCIYTRNRPVSSHEKADFE